MTQSLLKIAVLAADVYNPGDLESESCRVATRNETREILNAFMTKCYRQRHLFLISWNNKLSTRMNLSCHKKKKRKKCKLTMHHRQRYEIVGSMLHATPSAVKTRFPCDESGAEYITSHCPPPYRRGMSRGQVSTNTKRRIVSRDMPPT